jgi:hypothetical protein
MLLEERTLRGGSYAADPDFAPAVSLSELASKTWEANRFGWYTDSKQWASEAAYDARIDRAKSELGITLDNPWRSNTRLSRGRLILPEDSGAGPGNPFFDFDKRIRDLAEQNPDHREWLTRPISADARALTARTSAAADEAYEKAPPYWRVAAQLAGSLPSMWEDPLNVAALLTGPWGKVGQGAKAVLWSGVKVGALNAGAELAGYQPIKEWRQSAGLEYTPEQLAAHMGLAFAFGFGLDAGVRGAYRGGKTLFKGSDLPKAPDLPAGGQKPAPLAPPPADPSAALETAARSLPESNPVRRAANGDRAALDELVTAAGLENDPAIRGAKLADDADAVLRAEFDEADRALSVAKRLREDDEAGLAQATRHALDDSEPPPGHVDTIPEARGPDLSDEAPLPKGRKNQYGTTFQVDGKKVRFREVDPKTLTTDPETFQVKTGGSRLQNVTTWDADAAGRAVVFEKKSGEMVVADGHARKALADRLPEAGNLPAYVMREADGWTEADVRAHAAKKNMQEGSVGTIDAARVMRETPDVIDASVPLGADAMRQARSLARLSDDAFAQVETGNVPAKLAAMVGDLVPDQSRHAGLIADLAAAEPRSAAEARQMLGELMRDPANNAAAQQVILMGRDLFSLPDDTVARKARAEAMGFDTSRVWYHGTNKDVAEFDLSHFGANTQTADNIPAVFMSSQPKAASGYAAGWGAEVRDGANVMPLYARTPNIDEWDIGGGRLTEDVLQQALSEAKAAGRDGVVFRRAIDSARPVAPGGEASRNAGDVLAVFDPSNIRSVNAAFDPANARSANTLFSLPDAETLRANGFDEPNGPEAKAQVEALEAQFGKQIADAKKAAKGEVEPSLFSLPEVTGRENPLTAEGSLRRFASGQADLPTADELKIAARDIKEAELNDLAEEFGGDRAKAAKFIRLLESDGGDRVDAQLEALRQEATVKIEERSYEDRHALLDLYRTFEDLEANPREADHIVNRYLADLPGADRAPNLWMTRESAAMAVVRKAAMESVKAGVSSAEFSQKVMSRYGSHFADPQDAKFMLDALADALTGRPKALPAPSNVPLLSLFDASTYAHAPKLTSAIPQVFREIDEVASRLPEGVRLRVADALTFNGTDINGRWNAYDAIIHVALSAKDAGRTARHEEVHALKALGLMTDDEFDALYARATRFGSNLRKDYKIDERYGALYKQQFGDQAEAFLREETIAEMLADYGRGKRFGDDRFINELLDRIIKFLSDVQKALTGHGFTNPLDVFKAIESGEMGARVGLVADMDDASRTGAIGIMAKGCNL